MATLLNTPKAPNSAKIEEFVQKQLGAAQRRIRFLDLFSTGLQFAIGTLVFALTVQLVDRYFATPRGLGWGAVGLYLLALGFFLYQQVIRSSRRKINPYYAARQVEQTVDNAKNSLVTWVDFEEDSHLPGSIRNAIGQKAAKDLKGVDLNQALENKKLLWLGIAAVVFLLANAAVAFLPAKRTELKIEEPAKGDTTVFNNQDVAFQVRVRGRIPNPTAPDALGLRLWYNLMLRRTAKRAE